MVNISIRGGTQTPPNTRAVTSWQLGGCSFERLWLWPTSVESAVVGVCLQITVALTLWRNADQMFCSVCPNLIKLLAHSSGCTLVSPQSCCGRECADSDLHLPISIISRVRHRQCCLPLELSMQGGINLEGNLLDGCWSINARHWRGSEVLK